MNRDIATNGVAMNGGNDFHIAFGEHLAQINSQAFRAHEMISDMMLFARPPEVHPESTDIGALIEAVVSELNDDAQQQGTAIDIDHPKSLTAVVDPVHMSVALDMHRCTRRSKWIWQMK